ncbi:E3 ubiquitin-protein ligase TRAIP-like [Eriocheir sinensis]|uniref:E3 ubiquitin-protein ligase TRAIP-like n=1 Tax=Eriocheir sinensis TaxID=95602 RepID=UPI0021C7B4D9|nr:E3 ubiquitin-protein ligase TRAIP-like [Eriocheir sinensis]
MRVHCVICGELSLQTQDVSAAPCGHTFHSVCILQWLERSKSCPQCRSKATQRTLIKLFFDPGSSYDDQDPDALLQQIENIKFQVKLKEQEVKKVSDENDILKVQAVALREEFKGIETRLKDRDTTILAYKAQLQYVDRVTVEAKKAKEEAKKLRQKLNLLSGVEKVLGGTNEDVENVLQSNRFTNFESLATFVSVLKKELSRESEAKSKMRAEVLAATTKCRDMTKVAQSLQEEVEHLTSTVQQLEQDNESLEQENASLRKKMQVLEQAITSPSDDVRSSAIHRLLSESPAPEFLKRLHSTSLSDCITPEVVKKQRHTPSESKASDVTTETAGTSAEEKPSQPPALCTVTPVRPLSDSLNIMKGANGHHHRLFAKPNNSSSSILGSHKAVRDVGYDGLGGHYKFEEFPKPRTTQLLVASKRKYTTKKVGRGRGGGGRGGGSSVSSKAGKVNNIHDYFKNTFDDDFD